MQFKRCPSPICGRPFQVNQFKPRMSHSYDPGKIICPHCGLQIDDDNNSVFLTHAMSAREEAEFDAAEFHAPDAAGLQVDGHAPQAIGKLRGAIHPEHAGERAASERHPSVERTRGSSGAGDDKPDSASHSSRRKSGSSGESHSQ